mgnify:CR=1 FL=1
MSLRFQRLILIIITLVFFCSAVLLILFNTQKNIVFFYTPSELIKNDKNLLEKKVRIGGYVKKNSFLQKPKPIATLVSNENAAWESSLPTRPGSELIPGQMSLKSGVATIRFSSGAEVTLEAPAQIELNSEMEGKLNQGNAIIHVPKSAQGFVLITPSGYAVDHGTSFGVSIRPNQTITDFKVLEGEISVHSQNGDSLFLNENESVTLRPAGISEKSLINTEEVLSTTNEKGKVVRIRSNGKSRSIIRSDQTEYLNPDLRNHLASSIT